MAKYGRILEKYTTRGGGRKNSHFLRIRFWFGAGSRILGKREA